MSWESMNTTVKGPIEITAAELVEQAGKIAPVSGCRCRDCGAGAWRTPVYFVRDSAAWCPECYAERYGSKATA